MSIYDEPIYQMDRLEFLAAIPDGRANLILTSPPYNIGKAYERAVTTQTYLRDQAETIAACVRCLAWDGSICWQVGNHVNDGAIVPLDILLYPLFAAHGLILRNRIVWTFRHGLHASRRFSGRHETILWFTRAADYHFDLDPVRVPQKYPNKRHFKGPNIGELSGNPLGANPGDVWDIPNVKHNHREKTDHPCQFPVELAERLILALTRPGDMVIDPYVGSGTTIAAAYRNDRIGIGSDTDAGYCAIARDRVRDARNGNLPVREIGTLIHGGDT